MNTERQVGVGPHPLPWPEDEKYDTELLEHGDHRNVEDKYRYWTVEAIKSDLHSRAVPLHIAIENWQHDSNIGTIVRTANAFNVECVHIIGKRQWNKRGAMVTDRYLEVVHHATVSDFVEAISGRAIIGVDNIPKSKPLRDYHFAQNAVLVFGGEGPGLSDELVAHTTEIVRIEQYGSSRSINVGVAAGIVMYQWIHQHIAS